MPRHLGLPNLFAVALFAGSAPGQTADVISDGSGLLPSGRGRIISSGGLPTADVGPLVAKLAADDFRERERAGAALVKAGEAAIPELKAALAKSADPEAARRLEVILERLEAARLTEPRRVTLKVERQPAKDLFAELTKQTGYKFRLDAKPDKALVTFDWNGTPFLQAVDQLCDALQLNSNVEEAGGVVQIFDGDQVNPHAAYAGPFRVVATNIQSNRNVQIGGLSRRNPLARQPDFVNVTVTIQGEPKAALCAVGQPLVLKATDDLHNSLLFAGEAGGPGDDAPPGFDLPPPTFRSHTAGLSFTLNRADRRAELVRECRVKVTLAVLAETRPEVVVADVARSQGKKFTGRTHLLEVGGPGPAGSVTVTVRRKHPAENEDYSWINTVAQRFEAFDAQGKQFRNQGTTDQTNTPNAVTLTMQFAHATPGAKPVPVARLQLVEWAVRHKPVEFTLKDLPLP